MFRAVRIPFILGFSMASVATALVWPALKNSRVNGDIYWQRWLGNRILDTHHIPTHLGHETLSAVGAPWVPQEWLLSIALALAQRSHLNWLMATVAVGAVVLTMLLCVARVRNKGTDAPFYLAVVAILVGLSTFESFGVRAQVFGWALFALLLLLLDHNDRRVWLSIPVVVVWANIHASVMLAPVVALIYSLGTLIDNRAWTPRAGRYLALVPLLLLATCATPLGWHLPAYAFALEHSPIRTFIIEWQPVGVADGAFWMSTVPICFGLGFLVWKRFRLPATDILMTLACGYLLWDTSRNIPIFAIAVAPIVCASVTRFLLVKTEQREHRWELMLKAIIITVALPLMFLLSVRGTVAQYAKNGYLLPILAISTIESMPGEKRLFCYNFSSCSLAIDDAHVRTFMDGRCDPFPWPIWQKYRIAMYARHGWERVLDAYHITVVLTLDGTPLTRVLARSTIWQRTYHQNGYAIFTRRAL